MDDFLDIQTIESILPGSNNKGWTDGEDGINQNPGKTPKINNLSIINQAYIINISDTESAELAEKLKANKEIATITLTPEDSFKDAIRQLEDKRPLNESWQSVHILGHGKKGSFNLGGCSLNNNNISSYSDKLQKLGTLFSENGDLLLYGCSIGRGKIGKELIKKLSEHANIDVAASNNPTGVDQLTGQHDWTLEVQAGLIESKTKLLEEIQWNGSLEKQSSSSSTADQETGYKTNVGPSKVTLVCQDIVYTSGVQGTYEGIDQPLAIDPYEPIQPQGKVFRNVQLKRIDAGVVTPNWSAEESGAESANQRGQALYWIPRKTTKDSPRVLFVHGGSWTSGSPWDSGYATFAAKLAKKLQMPVLSIDYTLVGKGGNFNVIQKQIGKATKFMSKHDPLKLLVNKQNAKSKSSVPLFIIGDSSGGSSAFSALVAQASPQGLKGAGSARLSGGVFFSPWVNLESNGPTYLSNLYSDITDGNYRLGDILFGKGPVEKIVSGSVKTAKAYIKDSGISLKDPIANPLYAKSQWLENLPPTSFNVGQAEALLSDSAIISQKIAATGRPVEFHQYDGMWHDFQMYEDGCGYGEKLLFAESAYNAAKKFLKGIARGKTFKTSNSPLFYSHYEYPQGVDTAAGISPFKSRT
ncbi:MAG: DUF4347 domain-containing protein [Prochlorococcus sp.]